MNNKIIAVDFDGTIVKNKYPDIGEPKTEVIAALLEEQRRGAKLILWTCRRDKELTEAVRWCEGHGLMFAAVNEGLSETEELYVGETRKVYADEYWDDKGVKVV
jgi:hydroxymethylpyrimidine pyrophosphatase-like HAD family hydrolase